MSITLRITGGQHRDLRDHLFSGDGYEAVSVGLCGRLSAPGREVLCLREIVHIPHEECGVRAPDRVTWPTRRLEDLLADAIKHGYAVVKFHSHPGGLETFSKIDDVSDTTLFRSVHGWTDGEDPHLSVVVLPTGRMFGRAVHANGAFEGVVRIAVAGDDIDLFDSRCAVLESAVRPEQDRHARFFGEATTRLMQRLAVGVLGCSGTGGPVCEMLGRLGIGRMVVVDPETVGIENLNRIPNATHDDAVQRCLKVDVVARAIKAMGMGTEVVASAENIAESPRVVRALAGCDVLFGCVDSAEGRHILTRVATFYNLPYVDVGIKLEADRGGRIDQVCGTVHYLQPGGSTLLDRGVYTMERVRAEGKKREDPEGYRELLRDKYIQGADETRPAVVTVNTLFAARAVNEFLARLHPYRLDGNEEYAVVRESLSQMEQYLHRDDEFDHQSLSRHVGRGDVRPLLDMPALSERGAGT